MKLTKSKAFTLIELLAVIVILAIILLIATPIILNVIADARKGAFKSSAGYLVKAAENKYMTNQMNNKREDIVVTYENGELTSSTDLDYRGEKPKNGTIVVRQDGKVGIAIDNGKWCALKNYEEEQVNLIKLEEDNCKLSEVPVVVSEFDEVKGVNKPVLFTDMKPVIYNEITKEWDEVDPEDTTWYDYTNKKWANARTKDGSFWVWIPRYAYKIASGYHTSTTGTIEIKFLKERTNETVDGTVVETSGYDVQNKNTSQHYFKHPAFTFNGEELGFWVAKFEPSVADQTDLCYTSASTANCDKTTLVPKIIPNARSWRYTTISNQFEISINMKNNSVYGWLSSEVDTHMMKNDEWGAVSYLSKSIYGANTEEVWINPANDFTTGCAGTGPSVSSTTGCQHRYDTANGVKASTTHNIYGVYDMSGGAYEYVSSYVNNGHSNLMTYGQSILNAENKYKNIYEVGTTDTRSNNYEKNKNIYGDAVYETSSTGENSTSWYVDYSYMPYTSYPWFLRGGHHSHTTVAGVFYFHYNSGFVSSDVSFRPVVVPLA